MVAMQHLKKQLKKKTAEIFSKNWILLPLKDHFYCCSLMHCRVSEGSKSSICEELKVYSSVTLSHFSLGRLLLNECSCSVRQSALKYINNS